MRLQTGMAVGIVVILVLGALAGAALIYRQGRAKEAELEREASDRAEVEVQHQVEWIQRQIEARVRAIPVPGFVTERREPTGADANALLAEPGPGGGR